MTKDSLTFSAAPSIQNRAPLFIDWTVCDTIYEEVTK